MNSTSTANYRKAVRRQNKDMDAYMAEIHRKSRQALSGAELLFQKDSPASDIDLFLNKQEDLSNYLADQAADHYRSVHKEELEFLFGANEDQSAEECALNFQYHSGHFDENEHGFEAAEEESEFPMLADGCFSRPSSELVIEDTSDEFDFESIKNGRKVYR